MTPSTWIGGTWFINSPICVVCCFFLVPEKIYGGELKKWVTRTSWQMHQHLIRYSLYSPKHIPDALFLFVCLLL